MLITLAGALVMHWQGGTAADRQAARRITPNRIESAGASPAAPPASQPRQASILGVTTCPQTVRTQLGRADPCHPAVQPEDLQ